MENFNSSRVSQAQEQLICISPPSTLDQGDMYTMLSLSSELQSFMGSSPNSLSQYPKIVNTFNRVTSPEVRVTSKSTSSYNLYYLEQQAMHNRGLVIVKVSLNGYLRASVILGRLFARSPSGCFVGSRGFICRRLLTGWEILTVERLLVLLRD